MELALDLVSSFSFTNDTEDTSCVIGRVSNKGQIRSLVGSDELGKVWLIGHGGDDSPILGLIFGVSLGQFN